VQSHQPHPAPQGCSLPTCRQDAHTQVLNNTRTFSQRSDKHLTPSQHTQVSGFLAASLHGDGGVVCDSLDCGVYFERRKLQQELATSGALLQAAERALCPQGEMG